MKVWEVMFRVGKRERGKAVCTTRENAPKGRKQTLPVGDKRIDAHYRLVGAIFWRNGDLSSQVSGIAVLETHCIVPSAALGLGNFTLSHFLCEEIIC